ncbi:unnamed protein product [Merluccius merluccius]
MKGNGLHSAVRQSLMDLRDTAVVWGLLLAWVTLGKCNLTKVRSGSRPHLLDCVFLQRSNVTCRWEPGAPPPPPGPPPPATRYTLVVEKMRRTVNQSLVVTETFGCSTSTTSCTAHIHPSNVAFVFCVSVVVRGGAARGGVGARRGGRSLRRCQSGRKEVMLAPVSLLRVDPVRTKPRCLLLEWDRPLSYAVSHSEINGGNLTSQIEYFTQEQTCGRQPVRERRFVQARTDSFQVCLFRPGATYCVRLRNRYLASSGPWSPWSPQRCGSTAEDAPSAAPPFWRQVLQTDESGWRRVSLLWKPLHAGVANGRVVFHNVSCRWRDGPALEDLGTCGVVRRTATSCDLLFPPGSFSCSIAATNSAGASPASQIWLLSGPETEKQRNISKDAPPPSQITVTPLDDHSLDVRWTAPADQSVNSFVVEWSAVTSDGRSALHWERLNASQEQLVITDGVEPHVRYGVRVVAVYAHGGTGRAAARFAYTRQGVPSAGPEVEVQEIRASRLELTWRPLPVEQRRGYIQNYTVYYTHEHNPTRSKSLPAPVLRCSLGNLLPGCYILSIVASTVAGPGAAGPTVVVSIAKEDMSVEVIMVLPLLTAAVLLLGLLTHRAM